MLFGRVVVVVVIAIIIISGCYIQTAVAILNANFVVISRI